MNCAFLHLNDLGTDLTEYHQLGVLGMKHTLLLPNKKTYLKSVLSLSWQSDRYVRIQEHNGQPVLIDSNRYNYPTIRFATTLDHKFSAASVIRTGIIYNQFFFSVYGKRNNRFTGYETYVDEQGNTGSAEGFIQWKYRLTSRMEINSGIHATHFLLNDNFTLEPRFGAKWRVSSNAAFSYGFGLHSRIAPISLYFAKITTPTSPCSQDARLYHFVMLQNTPASLFCCNGACLAVFSSLQADIAPVPGCNGPLQWDIAPRQPEMGRC